MPTSGLVFYAPLSAYAATSETGQNLSYYNATSSNFATRFGIDAFDCSTTTRRVLSDTISMTLGAEYTMSVWCSVKTLTNFPRGMCFGNDTGGRSLTTPDFWQGTWDFCVGGYQRDVRTGYYGQADKWFHCVQTFNHGICKLYVDGDLKYTSTSQDITINNPIVSFGAPTTYTNSNYLRGYVACGRLYERVLTDEEIAVLATELTPQYTVTANDLSFSLYQKNETYGITYSSVFTPTFEIIAGELPSTISFNTSTGKFTGKGLADADHVYTLTVRVTAPNSTPAECTVTIHTYMTARISLTAASWDFFTEASSSKSISYTSDETISEWSIDSGTLPNGVTFSNGMFTSNGQQTANEQQTVTVRAKSAHNQTGATAQYTLRVKMNELTINTTLIKFNKGSSSTKAISYTADPNSITPVWTMTSGTLPANVSYANGMFTCDGLQTTSGEAVIGILLESSTGCSTPAEGNIEIVVSQDEVPDPIIEDGLVFYMPCESNLLNVLGPSLSSVAGSTPQITSIDGVQCIHFEGSSTLQGEDESYFIPKNNSNNGAYTVCFWMKYDSQQALPANEAILFLGGDTSVFSYGSEGIFIESSDNSVKIVQEGHWAKVIKSGDSSWHFYAIQTGWSGAGSTYLNAYYDTTFVQGESRNYKIPSKSIVTLGSNYDPRSSATYHDYFNGYISRVKIYNRILNSAEIAALAAEFTPTT